MDTEIMTENYCDSCDDVLNVVFNMDDFYAFKVGRIRCKCGHIVMPCNECRDEDGEHYDCGDCPWKNAEIADAMSDEEMLKWTYENEPENYYEFLEDNCMNDYWRCLAGKMGLPLK